VGFAGLQRNGKLGAPELLGIHVNLPGVVPPEIFKAVASGESAPANLSAEEKHAFDQLKNSLSGAPMRRSWERARKRSRR
jgi:hypothetical protein